MFQTRHYFLQDLYHQQFIEKVVRPGDFPLSKQQQAFFHNKKIKYLWDEQLGKFIRVEWVGTPYFKQLLLLPRHKVMQKKK